MDHGDISFDNIVIHSSDSQGHAVTPVVTLPYNRLWDYVQIGKFENRWSKTKFTVLMPYANHVFPAHSNITGWTESITDIYMDDTDKLYLDFWMTGEDGNFPRVDWWRIYWRPDPPTQASDIPDIEMREDEPQRNVVDLTDYFADWYVAGMNLAYSIEFCSNYSHVRPFIEGRNISIELPTKDWYGTETVRVNCSDGEFNVTSRNITVNVSPVNDPPTIAPLATLDVLEENATTFNITPFLADIDTPIENLTVRADSSNCTVSGQNLTLLYTVGNVDERIPVHVSDGEFEVNSFLQVHVINVNDPPIILPIPKQTATEEVPFVIDLGPFLSDEDNPVSGLIITCEHPNLVNIDGLKISMMFPEYIAPTTVAFNASDGMDVVRGSFELEVIPVNDPPVLRSIGGIPLNDTPLVRLREGEEVVLPLEITDVDSQTPRVYVDSDMAGVEVLANGSLRIVSAHGEIGTFWASLTVDDQDGGNVSANLTILVVNVNDPPAVPRILSPANGASFNESVAIVFNGAYDDPDMGFGQVLQIVWATNGSGEIARFSSDEAGPFSRSNLTPGQHVVTVTVSDGEFSRSASVTISVKAKEVPPIVPPTDGGDDGRNGGISILVIGSVIAIIAVLIGVLLFLRSRKGD